MQNQNASIIKRAQGRLGVKDDGVPGKQTFAALAIALGLFAGQYTKTELVQEAQRKLKINVDGIDGEDFWTACVNYLDAKEASKVVDTGSFEVLEVPKLEGPIPTNGVAIGLIAKFAGPLLKKIRGGAKSKGTFGTGLTSLVGGIVMGVKAYFTEDPELAITLLVGSINAVIAGAGLMIARDSTTSDEQAGAKKVKL